jgi:hypothetical protein
MLIRPTKADTEHCLLWNCLERMHFPIVFRTDHLVLVHIDLERNRVSGGITGILVCRVAIIILMELPGALVAIALVVAVIIQDLAHGV